MKYARATVFVASFCLMTVELLAGRVMAPYLGVSLYTWTAVIGVILLGVTVGNYAGGRLADRRLSHALLGACFGGAGLSVGLSLVLAPLVGPWLEFSDWRLPVATAVFCLLLFFPAAFFLSTVSPQVVKFDLQDLQQTGTTIGTLGAWSAFGSIVGTFATGFIFTMYFGTHRLLVVLAALLVAFGVSIAAQHKRI